MTIYFGVLEGKGRNWGVWFPDIPGCVGAGETADGAIENARSALELFDELDRTEGLVSPAARGVDDLLKEPEVSEAVNNGDRLVPFEIGRRPDEIKIRA
jgi:predicted RNase H-like HicB family nuclease